SDETDQRNVELLGGRDRDARGAVQLIGVGRKEVHARELRRDRDRRTADLHLDVETTFDAFGALRRNPWAGVDDPPEVHDEVSLGPRVADEDERRVAGPVRVVGDAKLRA